MNEVSNLANTYRDLYILELRKYAKRFNKIHKEEIFDKCYHAEFVYYRYVDGSKQCRKRPLVNTCLGKDHIQFRFKEDGKLYWFNLDTYGVDWVVDKKDYFPILKKI